MFFELSKFFSFFLSPTTWIITLLILFFTLKRKIIRRICLIVSLVFFVFFTNSLLVDYIKYQTVKSYCNYTIDEEKEYRVGIVMGGFSSVNKQTEQLQYEENRADRLWEAIRLWKNGKIDRVLITGDPSTNISEKGNTTAPLFFDYMNQLGIPDSIFILEQHARNTYENAVYSIEILKEKNIKAEDCLLITSATHMKRSLGCFSKAGFQLDYITVNNYDKPTEISHRSFYPNWKTAVGWNEILNEWIGEVVYKIKGYM